MSHHAQAAPQAGLHLALDEEDARAGRPFPHYTGHSRDGQRLLLVRSREAEGRGARRGEGEGAGQDHGGAQEQDDVQRDADDQLPAAGGQTKLL